jgi:succinyl-diaminopimelate desuccinylase
MNSLVDTLVELVDIPSVTGEEEEIAAALEFRLSRIAPVRRIGNSLVAGDPGGRPYFALYGHTDTVPEQGNSKAVVDGDRVRGLGTSDMKAGLAVMTHLLEDAELASGPYGMVGVFYDKEEGPSADNGLERVLDDVPDLLDAELSIVLEPTDLRVEVGCNGALNAEVTFLGNAAHSARPWFGENAVTKAGKWLAELHEREPESFTIDGLEFKEVFSVTKALGGLANNVIPPRFTVNLNHRFPPVFSLEEAKARVLEVAAPADEVVIKDAAPAGAVATNDPHLARLEAIVGDRRTAKQGWTDVARLTERGLAAVNYGPGESGLAHQAAESVPIVNLDIAYNVLRRFLLGSQGISD